MQNYIEVLPLGAGQCVGRSCIIVSILDKNIMFDCGLMMAKYDKQQRVPNFNFLKKKFNKKNINQIIDVVLITHFHLDHCGALPYLTQFNKYNGAIIASVPTKAIIPYMLQDYKKVFSESVLQKDQKQSKSTQTSNKNDIIYTSQQIKESVKKIDTMQLMEEIQINGIKIKSYYAGHVLGACMFYVQYKNYKVVYTGDYNTNSDRHLGGAWIQNLKPHVLITQTTYASIIRDSKRDRQRTFLKYIQQTIDKGGKVLIPVFALGRAQEICILLQTYWNRTKNKIPIYFATGMIQKANFYYRLFASWENQKIQNSFLKQNTFDFKHIRPFDKALIRSANPMVLLATPGMLHGGLSMQVFKQWCHDPKNTIILAGHCVQGTLGNKLLNNQRFLNIDKKNYEVRMKVESVSFSAHADAKGIMNLIQHLQPRKVVFVHGEKKRMKSFCEVVSQNFKVQVLMPSNFQVSKIKVQQQFYQVQICKQNYLYEQQQLYIVKKKEGLLLADQQRLIQELNQMLPLLPPNQEYHHKTLLPFAFNNTLFVPLKYPFNPNTILNDLFNFLQTILDKKGFSHQLKSKYVKNVNMRVQQNKIKIGCDQEQKLIQVHKWICTLLKDYQEKMS